MERIGADVETLKAENPDVKTPTDLVTASGSDFDPDISPEGALFQELRSPNPGDCWKTACGPW